MMNKVLIMIIKQYQRFISPILGKNCRFYPSCSEYSIDAFSEYGLIKASSLTILRIFKCNPLFEGGYDPLPRRNQKK